MTDFKPWTPPPGAVVDPPVHPETEVLCMWSDGSKDEEPRRAGSQNWSSVGDGPCVVAYAVVEEYVEPKGLREWWLNLYEPDAAVAHSDRASADRCSAGARIECIHVREVPDPPRPHSPKGE